MTNEDHDHKSLNDGWARFLPERFRGAVVPVVRLNGAIGAVTPLRPGLTLSGVSKLLEKAFETKRARAVALVINSPGGSPVQSRQIYARIRQLAEAKKIPVLVFVEDVAASGGYMIACAGDEIFCDPSSILGSIGVIGGTFGFQDLIKKVGIERRLYTSGDHKGSLDPFLPENPDDVTRLKAIQREIHDSFIDLVKMSRGARLQGEASYLFSGEYWAGERSVKLGLADGIGDLRSVLRARYGERVRMPVIAPKSGVLSTLAGKKPGAGAMIGAGFADDLISALERARCGRVTGFEREGHMPPLVLIALGVMGGAALLRFAMKEGRRVNRELDEVREQAATDPKDTVRLRRDPQTGAYRPH